jgi:outer membrane protein assembly factor BamA
MKNFIRIILIVIEVSFISFGMFAQADTTNAKPKKRFNFPVFPIIAYDADMGFQYGIVANMYDYGNYQNYPEYRHGVKLEISRFTKGSGVNQVFYDSKYLIPGNIRLTADMSYLTEKALDFYGYNGYQAVYTPEWEDDEDTSYITRMFYRHERKMFRFTCDFQGPILEEKLRWLAGFGIMNFKTGTVDIDRINKGKDEDKILPDTITLYDQYVDWGIIPKDEKDGGNANFIKAGLVYDTRDNEPNPMKGLWDEALLVYAPGFLFNDDVSFLKLILIHRQYFTIIKKKVNLCYRLGYQGTIAGHTPYYFQPYMLSSFSTATKTDGLGGAKNLRGILRNRVVGDGVAWGNVEVRWRVVDFIIAKQNFYLGLVGFCDAGMVVQEVDIEEDGIDPAVKDDYFDFTYENDKIHPSAGAGLRIGWNENFIITVDYGFAMDHKDGLSGLYIAFGNLF